MSTENGLEADIQVSDDEEYTDKKIKQRILNHRELLNDTQHQLYSARLVEPDVSYSEFDALLSWGNLVRSYIRDLSLLLNNDQLAQAQYFREGVDLGRVTIVPPEKDGYDFSLVAQDIDDDMLIRRWDGFQRGANLPEPKQIPFTGLHSIIEHDRAVEAHWTVVKNPRASRPNQEVITLHSQQPIPKRVYEKALMAADEFLQQCGIGLDINASDYDGGETPGL